MVKFNHVQIFQLIENENELMRFIRHGRKNVLAKQKISSKYHQFVVKCNSLHVSISCVVQLIEFN